MNADKVDNFWEGLGYFGVGAAAGAVGAGVGAGVSSALAGGTFGAGFVGSSAAMTATTSFATGATIGGAAGFSGGFISGFGNGLMGGQSFGEALCSGTKYGIIGGASGALLGGVIGGLNALNDNRTFLTGDSIITQNSYSQNLVENPSFEDFYSEVTQSTKDSFICKNWLIPNKSSPDYFNRINTEDRFGVPINIFGSHSAFSGKAYLGLCLFKWDGYLEQITGTLKETLKKDSIYKISLTVRFSGKISYLCSNKIGIKFHSEKSIYFINEKPWYDKMYRSEITADLEFNISSTCDTIWEVYNGFYKAFGDEKYFSIGLFYQSDLDVLSLIKEYRKAWPKGEKFEKRFYKRYNKNPLVSVNKDYEPNENLKAKMAYYFIDDISVELDKLH